MNSFKALVLSANLLPSGTFSSLLKVYSVDGDTLAEPIVVDFKTGAERGGELVSKGYDKHATVTFEAEGINEFQVGVDRVLEGKGDFAATRLHRPIGAIKNIVVEKWARPMSLETRADAKAAPAPKPMAFNKAAPATKLDKVLDSIGLAKK